MKGKPGKIVTLSFLMGALLASCSATKSVPDGDALYTGSHIRVEAPELSHKERKKLKKISGDLIRPRPNNRFLGIPFKLLAYNLAGHPKKKGSPASWLKNKVGEPPVLLSALNLEFNRKVLQNDLENRGYFQAVVAADTSIKHKKGSASFTLRPGRPYVIRNVHYETDTSHLLLRRIGEDVGHSILKPGDQYDLNTIKAERERIDAVLKEKGYYYFNPDYILVQVDSTVGDHQVDYFVKVKSETPPQARKEYRINNVYIFSNYRLNTIQTDTSRQDAQFYKGYFVVDKRNLYKPSMFSRSMQFNSGDLYNRTAHNQTINRLVNLGIFKFVKNRFEPVKGTDSALLNTYYYLTPMPKKSIRAEITALTKSNNLTGSSISFGWQNRNTFRGGELFAVKATGGFEIQYSGQLKGFNTYRGGLETSMTFPRYLIPFANIESRGGYVPRTRLLLGYDILNKRKLYTMNSFKANWGYTWKENAEKEHELNPISITYVQPLHVSQEYTDSAIGNPNLQKAIEKQFILGSSYNFTYNQMVNNQQKSGFYFNGNIDLSGNLAGLVTGSNAAKGDTGYILHAPFAQYARFETDLRYYFKISSNSVWASRIIAGLGIPYGNSGELPFIKQFFVGGNNSVRAFRSRSLGPGTYKANSTENLLPDQSGDIKLELNTEWRQKISGFVHGALFVDAGNIWLYRDKATQPGGKFTRDFLSELAVGAGAGLRFDISFLVLRLDVAFPLRNPWLPRGNRWVIDQINFGDPGWRSNNLVYNLAIGYPF